MPAEKQKERPDQRSLAAQRVVTYIALAQQNEKLWGGFVVFLGTLFLLGAVPFYPIYLVPLLALLCGGISYFSRPPFGTLLGLLIAFPAVIYQSSVFGWLFLLIIVIALFEAFEHWLEISVLEILIAAPFSFGQLPFLGFITILGMVVATLYFGSKRSILISIPSVLMILLLSSLWHVENSAFMPINLDLYTPDSALKFSKAAVPIQDIGTAFGNALGSFASVDNAGRFFASISVAGGNIITLLINDSGLVQLIAWALALYIVSYLSGKIKKRSQIVSSLALIIVIPFYYVAGIFSGTGFSIEFVGVIAISIVVLGVMEQLGVKISRESALRREEKMKAYGKFGMKDIGAAGAETLADVGNYDDIKTELQESILMPLEKKEIAYTYGIKPPSGVLLFGPPGTGKTMLMRALAHELKYNFIEVKCSQILSQWYGESEKNLAEVFSNARKTAPTILFFDEIDAIGKKRSESGTDEVTPRVLTTLLQEMDGAVKSKQSVIVVGATNVPNKLDPALLRPGRFDKIIYMHLPDLEGRKMIFEATTAQIGRNLGKDVDYDVLAKKTSRFSGADIKNIVVEAKRFAAKRAAKAGYVVPVEMSDFLSIINRVKPSVTLAQIDEYEQFRIDFERRVGAKKEKPEEEVTGWKDVAGLEEVKRALLEAIEIPLLHEDLMKKFRVKPSKGILLFGPPGTGKTLLVKAASNELNASFQFLSGAEIVKRGYLQAVSVIRDVFNRGRENAPAIIFIDEIETFAPARGMGGSEVIGQLLSEMDGMKGAKNVVVIGATNKPEMLDAAILRPGRFDKIFYVPPPDKRTREKIFAIHLSEFARGVNLEKLADLTPHFTGADIASVCQEAKMAGLRSKLAGQEQPITTDTVVEIIKRRRPSVTARMLRDYQLFLEKYGERK